MKTLFFSLDKNHSYKLPNDFKEVVSLTMLGPPKFIKYKGKLKSINTDTVVEFTGPNQISHRIINVYYGTNPCFFINDENILYVNFPIERSLFIKITRFIKGIFCKNKKEFVLKYI